jgi:hypothetical protein
MANIAPNKYKNVSLHVGIIDAEPQFCATTENVGYGTTIEIAYQNRHVYAHG